MKSLASPNDSSRPRPSYTAGEAACYVSPSTRQRAQEADASMTLEGSRYTPRDPTGRDLAVAGRQYFLP